MRRAVHDTLAVSAFYIDATLDAEVPVTVRHHTKIALHGDIDGDYASVLEGINRLVFDADALAALPLVLRRGGIVRIPEYGTRFELDQRSPDDGPVNAYWSVVQVP